MHPSRRFIQVVQVLMVATVVCLVGCPPRQSLLPPVTDDVPMSTVVSRVNSNTQGMNFLLRAGGVSASGRIVKASGKTEAFDANGTLYFRRPRSLYMELQHALAGKIEIGSNDQEFWYWERLEHPRYYTARHSQLAAIEETDIPLRPDQLLDMLGFRELPEGSQGGQPAIFKVGPEQYFIDVYEPGGAGGQTHKARTVEVSRRPPFLTTGIIYYNSLGRAWLRADLTDYRPIEGTSVLVPRKVKVQSLQDKSRLSLEFSNMRPSDNQQIEPQRIARSPLQRGEDVGEIIRMDRAPTGLPATISQPPPAPTAREH